MTKSIIANDGEVINYANVISFSVEENDDADTDIVNYLLVANTVAKIAFVLGEYETEKEAVDARKKLVEWLEQEAFGVYYIPENKGE